MLKIGLHYILGRINDRLLQIESALAFWILMPSTCSRRIRAAEFSD
jgi:hypothetical protein